MVKLISKLNVKKEKIKGKIKRKKAIHEQNSGGKN